MVYRNIAMDTLPENDSQWKPIKSAKESPEAVRTCQCGHKYIIHENYSKAGISGCVGNGRCFDTETVIKQMLALRKITFISYEFAGKKRKITIICPNGHQFVTNWDCLKMGSGCITCKGAIKTLAKKPQLTGPRLIRPDCSCRGTRANHRPFWCIHYNHLVMCPESARDWDYPLNGQIRPEHVAPLGGSSFWWRCRAEHCKMPYLQPIGSRICNNLGCPYCSGRQVCEWNCLATKYPTISREWHPDNELTPRDITAGSRLMAKWICDKHESPHIWNQTVSHRTSDGSGCPKCNQLGFDQIDRGHAHFVESANKIHNNKYQYPENYAGSDIKIQIICSVISHGKPHGLFMQTPNSHKSGHGCPKCASEQAESKGIRELKKALEELGYIIGKDFYQESVFPGLAHVRDLSVDIYIPGENIVIEYDGQQHFVITGYWGGEEKFTLDRYRDRLKDAYFVKNRIHFVRIPYTMTPTAKFISEIIAICRSVKHFYLSYDHFYSELKDAIDPDITSVMLYPYK